MTRTEFRRLPVGALIIVVEQEDPEYKDILVPYIVVVCATEWGTVLVWNERDHEYDSWWPDWSEDVLRWFKRIA